MNEDQSDQAVVDVLTTDFREATSLIGKIWSTSDREQRRDLADTLISELVRHSVADEMYDEHDMQEHLPDGEQAVEHDMQEHKALEKTMKKLEGVDAGEHASRRFCASSRPPCATTSIKKKPTSSRSYAHESHMPNWRRWPARSRLPRGWPQRDRIRRLPTRSSFTSWWAPEWVSSPDFWTNWRGRSTG